MPVPILVCRIIGAVLIVIALWGFIDGRQVLIFHVNTTHNIVHLVSGIASLACGFASLHAARVFCIAFGAVYGLVAALGFLGFDPVIEMLHLNDAGNWLHLGLAAIFLSAAAAPATPRTARPRATGRPAP